MTHQESSPGGGGAPRTAAGRALLEFFDGNHGQAGMLHAILAIEAEAGALAAAWAAAEAALPQTGNPNIETTWMLTLQRDIDHPYYEARAWDFDEDEVVITSGWHDTPAAALAALTERLREGAQR